MCLYNANLGEIEYDDDDGADTFSLIDRQCGVDSLPAGTYYVKINEYNNNDQIASYNLSYSLVRTCGTPTVPDIDVTPVSLSVTLSPGQTANRTLTIRNTGQGTLNFQISDVETTPAQSAIHDQRVVVRASPKKRTSELHPSV